LPVLSERYYTCWTEERAVLFRTRETVAKKARCHLRAQA